MKFIAYLRDIVNHLKLQFIFRPLKFNIEKYRDYINNHKSNYLPDQ